METERLLVEHLSVAVGDQRALLMKAPACSTDSAKRPRSSTRACASSSSGWPDLVASRAEASSGERTPSSLTPKPSGQRSAGRSARLAVVSGGEDVPDPPRFGVVQDHQPAVGAAFQPVAHLDGRRLGVGSLNPGHLAVVGGHTCEQEPRFPAGNHQASSTAPDANRR